MLLRILFAIAALGAALSARTFDVREFGAKGDFVANDTARIQAAIDACHKAGGGMVLVPAGRYISGTLELRSNVNLHLDNGATIFVSLRKEDYQASRSHGVNRGHLLVAHDAENIGVTGQGTLNGRAEADYGHRWGAPEEDGRFRIGIILFTQSRNVTLRDFTIRYSDFWTLHLNRCEGVVLDAVKILNNPRRLNSDGIDLTSCRNVRVTNCHVVAGDDAIDPKSEAGYPVENVVVSNCTLETTTTGIKIGTATAADFRNLHFSNITINAPSGIGFYMKDGGAAENITFSNITIQTPERSYREVVPIFMDIERRHKDSALSHIRDISFRDIYVRSGSGILLQGMPESEIENLSFHNLNFLVTRPDDFSKKSKPVGGGRSTSDERDTKYIRMPAYMTAAYVKELYIDGLRVEQSESAQSLYERSALAVHNSGTVTIKGMRGNRPKGKLGLAMIELVGVKDVILDDALKSGKSAGLVHIISGVGTTSSGAAGAQ